MLICERDKDKDMPARAIYASEHYCWPYWLVLNQLVNGRHVINSASKTDKSILAADKKLIFKWDTVQRTSNSKLSYLLIFTRITNQEQVTYCGNLRKEFFVRTYLQWLPLKLCNTVLSVITIILIVFTSQVNCFRVCVS